jgi:hypothetical protein
LHFLIWQHPRFIGHFDFYLSPQVISRLSSYDN